MVCRRFLALHLSNAAELMNRNDASNNADLYLMDTAAIAITTTTTTTITIHKYKAYLVRTLARVKYFHMALNLFSRAWPQLNLSPQPAPRCALSTWPQLELQPNSTAQLGNRSTCAALHSVCAAATAPLTFHKYRLLCTRNVR